jgi:hypothetical protein
MSKLFKNIFLGFLAVILLSSGFCRQVGAVSMTGYFSGKTQQVADGERVISGGLSKTIKQFLG